MEIPAASGTRQVTFGYDSAGQVMVMYAEGVRYYYVRNAQNDITGLALETGAVVVHYSYDSWGNPVSTSGRGAARPGSGTRSATGDTSMMKRRGCIICKAASCIL